MPREKVNKNEEQQCPELCVISAMEIFKNKTVGARFPILLDDLKTDTDRLSEKLLSFADHSRIT